MKSDYLRDVGNFAVSMTVCVWENYLSDNNNLSSDITKGSRKLICFIFLSLIFVLT